MRSAGSSSRTALTVLLLAALAAPLARADVTVQQQVTMKAAGLTIDSTVEQRTSGDKQRRDTQTHCKGFLALFCGNVQSGEIVRLDRQLEWQLEPKKRSYQEQHFLTAEQRAQVQQALQQHLAQMQQCMQQRQPAAASAPDTSQCDLSAPKLQVTQSDEHATVAGHDTRKSSVVISQTCTDRKTGDVCELDYGFDVWLTSDAIPGADEERSFLQNYLKAQGLDQDNPAFNSAMQQMLSAYSDQLKQLRAQAGALKGYPLRTTFRFSFGGEHCARAQQATQQASSRSPSHGLRGLAANAIGGGLGGLFGRHLGPAAPVATEAGTEAANAALSAADKPSSGPASSPTPASSADILSFTTETTSIDTTPISPDQFELPAGWKLVQPKPSRASDTLTCPVQGSGN
jgi:hypothetical protein